MWVIPRLTLFHQHVIVRSGQDRTQCVYSNRALKPSLYVIHCLCVEEILATIVFTCKTALLIAPAWVWSTGEIISEAHNCHNTWTHQTTLNTAMKRFESSPHLHRDFQTDNPHFFMFLYYPLGAQKHNSEVPIVFNRKLEIPVRWFMNRAAAVLGISCIFTIQARSPVSAPFRIPGHE